MSEAYYCVWLFQRLFLRLFLGFYPERLPRAGRGISKDILIILGKDYCPGHQRDQDVQKYAPCLSFVEIDGRISQSTLDCDRLAAGSFAVLDCAADGGGTDKIRRVYYAGLPVRAGYSVNLWRGTNCFVVIFGSADRGGCDLLQVPQ